MGKVCRTFKRCRHIGYIKHGKSGSRSGIRHCTQDGNAIGLKLTFSHSVLTNGFNLVSKFLMIFGSTNKQIKE